MVRGLEKLKKVMFQNWPHFPEKGRSSCGCALGLAAHVPWVPKKGLPAKTAAPPREGSALQNQKEGRRQAVGGVV